MIIEKSKSASGPTPIEFGRNEPATLVWRFTQRNGTCYRVAFRLGEFSVWEEGASEKEVFRINLGILEDVTKRARAAQFRAVMELKETRNELSLEERREIWQRCVQNPELRFCSTTRHHPSKLGGWRKCLDRAAQLLEGTGRRVPWSEEEALFAAEQ
jgi:hypothetical protein